MLRHPRYTDIFSYIPTEGHALYIYPSAWISLCPLWQEALLTAQLPPQGQLLGWPCTDPPAPTSHVLGLQMCATTFSFFIFIFIFIFCQHSVPIPLRSFITVFELLKDTGAIIYGHFSCVEHKASWERWRRLTCLRSEGMGIPVCFCVLILSPSLYFLILASKNSTYSLGVHRNAIVLLPTEDIAGVLSLLL